MGGDRVRLASSGEFLLDWRFGNDTGRPKSAPAWEGLCAQGRWNLTTGEWIESTIVRLEAKWVESARLEAQLLAAHVLGQTRSWVLAHLEDSIDAELGEPLLLRREAREPLAYILGWREFYGRKFAVGPGVLIPRQETEILVDAALELRREFTGIHRVLDICSGSGCIGITLALESEASVICSEISMSAIDYIGRNAHSLGAEVEIVQSDRFDSLKGREFDLIVANPPYVRAQAVLQPEIHDFEPDLALFAGEDGLDGYRWLAKDSANCSHQNTWLLVEVGNQMEDQVRHVFEAESWEFMRSLRDLASVERVLGFRRRV